MIALSEPPPCNNEIESTDEEVYFDTKHPGDALLASYFQNEIRRPPRLTRSGSESPRRKTFLSSIIRSRPKPTARKAS